MGLNLFVVSKSIHYFNVRSVMTEKDVIKSGIIK